MGKVKVRSFCHNISNLPPYLISGSRKFFTPILLYCLIQETKSIGILKFSKLLDTKMQVLDLTFITLWKSAAYQDPCGRKFHNFRFINHATAP